MALPGKASAIDRSHLEELYREVGPGDIERVISNMEAEFEFELRRLKIAVGLGDRDACRLALQALANDALEIGTIGLAEYSRELANTEDIDAIFAALAQLQLTADRAIAQLRHHVATLAAQPN